MHTKQYPMEGRAQLLVVIGIAIDIIRILRILKIDSFGFCILFVILFLRMAKVN